MHSTLEVKSKQLNRVEVWTSTGLLQNLVSFLFQSFCSRCASVLGIIVVLHDSVSARFQTFRILCLYRGVHGQFSDHELPTSCECKTCRNHHLRSTTIVDSWYEVFVLICCGLFSLKVAPCDMVKQFH